MNRLTGNWLRCLVWLVAVMLPVQPLAASHCSCSRDDASLDSAATTEARCCSKAHRCKSNGCGTSTDRRQKGAHADALPIAPCECPPSCPCQLQHLPKPIVKAQEVQVESSELICWFFVPPSLPALTGQVRHDSLTFDSEPPPNNSGLALCAALCRFLI